MPGVYCSPRLETARSYATPVDRMHPVRPIRSLFHPAIFVSILGQAAIHLYCMVKAVAMSTDAMGPELLKEVKDFHKKHKNWGDGDANDMMCAKERRCKRFPRVDDRCRSGP